MTGMQIGIIIFISMFFILGLATYFLIKRSGKRYIVAGKSLGFFLIGSMLLAQALDANATMGNAAGTYTGGFWAGFQFPLGLALCLVVTALFYAKPLNRMNMLTLPDFYFRRFGSIVEVLVSLLMAFSFIILVAGNLAGSAWILVIIFPNLSYIAALFIMTGVVAVYTIAGGLYACAATDVVQIYPAIAAFFAAFIWLLVTYGWGHFKAAIPPDFLSLKGLTSVEHGALLNWAGILALGLGDVIALDFMERIFAAKDGTTAVRGCYWGAGFTLLVGICASFIGIMGLTLVPGLEDTRMVLPRIAITTLPFVFGLFIMGGIIGAGLSTADGGLLGISTVFGRNLYQRNVILRPWQKKSETHSSDTEEQRKISDRKLLVISRIMAIPAVGAAIWLAYVKPEPGMLLVLAFDVVFAGCLVPLTLGIYWKKANGLGALAAVVVGSVLRLILYFTIPEHLAGLDTLIPPVVSLLVMVPVSLLTQEIDPPKHEVIQEIPSDELVLSAER